MQRLVRLFKESMEFTLTREHWVNSIAPIGIAIALMIVGPELDRILDTNAAFSALTKIAGYYLMLVVVSIAWYRAIGTTGGVRIEYKFSRRTWHYLMGFVKLMALMFLLVVVVFVILAVAGFDLSKFSASSPFSYLRSWLVSLPFMYIAVRFGFVFPAAANDKPMTLGDAFDASSSVQWSLLATILIIQLVGAFAGYVIAELHNALSSPLTYLIEIAGSVLLFLINGFTIAATGIAYKEEQQIS